MKLQFYLGHPAHFHLFKNVIKNLISYGHDTEILIKKKDVLEELLIESDIPFTNILPKGRRDTKLGILFGVIKRFWRAFLFTRKYKPDILIGTSVENSFLTKVLGIPSINLNEDDASVVPLYAKLSYPWATAIVTPRVCNNGKWEDRSTKYDGYHELAYLHPNHFKPDMNIVRKYVSDDNPFYIIRFAKLTAHHDTGIQGLHIDLVESLIELLCKKGKVLITSEKEIVPSLERYRLRIKANDIHHLLAFASLLIGDSQTMAAEAAVLGTPYIRYNNFVERIGYLNELETRYKLGFGIKPGNNEEVVERATELISSEEIKKTFQSRREIMLQEKIDVSNYLTELIDNFPNSIKV